MEPAAILAGVIFHASHLPQLPVEETTPSIEPSGTSTMEVDVAAARIMIASRVTSLFSDILVISLGDISLRSGLPATPTGKSTRSGSPSRAARPFRDEGRISGRTASIAGSVASGSRASIARSRAPSHAPTSKSTATMKSRLVRAQEEAQNELAPALKDVAGSTVSGMYAEEATIHVSVRGLAAYLLRGSVFGPVSVGHRRSRYLREPSHVLLPTNIDVDLLSRNDISLKTFVQSIALGPGRPSDGTSAADRSAPQGVARFKHRLDWMAAMRIHARVSPLFLVVTTAKLRGILRIVDGLTGGVAKIGSSSDSHPQRAPQSLIDDSLGVAITG